MVDGGLVMQNETTAAINEHLHQYKKLPKEFKANKGEKFFDLMDERLSPGDIDASTTIPDDVKPILKWHKQQEEAMRQEVIQQKRAMSRAVAKQRGLSDAEADEQVL